MVASALTCGLVWHVDVAGEPDIAGEPVRCIRDRDHRGRRHIARHPTALGDFVFLERDGAVDQAEEDAA